MGKASSHPPSSKYTQRHKLIYEKENMFHLKIQPDLYVCTSYVNSEMLKKNL